jgi:23S rRNA (guanosine2251-2'-O)-methyltransferase
VRDPGNLGTLARTLYALGGAGLVVPKNNSAFLGAGARRAAAGALEKLPVSRVVNLSRALDEAADAGWHIYGAAFTETSTSIYDATLRLPAILVLGSEESGIRHQVAERCEKMLHIPMRRDFDSLNVAQAGAICVAECARQNPAK